MNRYVIEGLCRDAIEGKTILVYGGTSAETRYLIRDCADYLARRDQMDQTSLRNGAEEVTTYTGGRIYVTGDLRGQSPQIVFLADPPSMQALDMLRWYPREIEVIRA